MKLQIVKVHGHGDFDKELVLLKALDDCQIGYYALADSTYTKDEKVSNKLRHFYWFPDKQIKKGELISLWTKQGENGTKKNEQGETVHRFYWGLKSAV